MQEKSFFMIHAINPFVLLLCLLLSFSLASADGWYDTNWQYRKEITIDSTKVDADLTNFPVLIAISDADLAGEALANGDDILFTGDDGTAKLDHEIEFYAAGDLVAWVRIPSLSSSTDTVIYLYYAHAGASNQENPTGVWDANYVMVQHLEETSGTHNDSTSNSNNSNVEVVTDQAATGSIDGADEFDGTDDYVRVPDAASLQFGEGSFTAEVWINPRSVPDSGGARIVNNRGTGAGGSYPGWQLKIKDQAGNWRFSDASIDNATGNYKPYEGSTTYAYNQWYQVVMVYDADSELRFYVNGVLDGNRPVGAYGSISNTLPTVIGASIADGGSEAGDDRQFFDGIIDEVRVSDIVRGSGWISTSYNNQQDPSGFAAVGNVQLVHAPLISNENPADGATSIALSLSALSFQLVDPDGDLMDYTVTTNPDIGSGSATGVTDGTYTVPVAGLSYNTTYGWTISVTDGTHPVSTVATFTTESDLPIISQEDPPDGAIDVPLNPTLKADILDEQGDSVDWEILININDTWQLLDSGTLPGGSGTVYATSTNVDQYNTQYSWKVQATSGGELVEAVYSFTTTENKMNFAAFTDSHIGGQDLYSWGFADHLDLLAQDIMNNTVPCDFTVHLGDIVMHSTSFVEGEGIPAAYDKEYNKFKPFLLQHLNMPFMAIPGNHDMADYYGGSHPGFPVNNNDPFNLVRSLIKATEMNSYPYAFMKNNILFIALPETDYHMFTKPTIYEYVEYMTRRYPDNTTIIFSHQAIEDTTIHDGGANTYRGKQDIEWWAALFRNNPQIKGWLHGHNHMLDWYQSDQSSALSHPVSDFGHEMVFSMPYAQADWGNYFEEDRIVIYSISPTKIETRAWGNNGAGGQWVSGYDHTWEIATTYDENGQDWYSFPLFLQDGEIQETDMKIFSPNISLELIGTQPMELFYDPRMETEGTSWGGENILGFGDDLYSEVTPTLPGMTVHGPADLDFPPKYPGAEFQGGGGAYWEDGRTGQPYHFFPVGTTHAGVPGATYTVTITARSDSGSGTINVDLSVSDWGSGTQYSTLAGSTQQVISHTFGTEYETVTGTYTVPSDVNAWFMQGYLDFTDTTDYDISLFSIKRSQDTNTTDNFGLSLNGNWYSHAGTLQQYEKSEFIINPLDLADENGVIEITSNIEGNHFGMARIIYKPPLLMGRNARFNVNSIEGNNYSITLQDDLSYSSDTFKMFPLNGKSGSIEVTSDDGSATRQVSDNGNEWIDCSTPSETTEVTLDITYGIATPDSDGDGIPDHLDNCPVHDNPAQEDTYPPGGNGVGDACDCEADFDCDDAFDVDAINVNQFLFDFGRSPFNDPCTNERFCYGDFDCNGAVDAADLPIILEDFGRSLWENPCPACGGSAWCSY
jgi:hypothetical protein